MLDIQIQNHENMTLVRLGGRLDSSRAPELEETLSRIDFNLLLDLSDLEFITSRGLWVILETHKRLQKRDRRLLLTGLSGRVREVFALTGVLDEIAVHDGLGDLPPGFGD